MSFTFYSPGIPVLVFFLFLYFFVLNILIFSYAYYSYTILTLILLLFCHFRVILISCNLILILSSCYFHFFCQFRMLFPRYSSVIIFFLGFECYFLVTLLAFESGSKRQMTKIKSARYSVI